MLGVIGGSGLYELSDLKALREHDMQTPFGAPSDIITEGRYKDRTVLFLPRHGRGHKLLPHEVNYRANIFALKQLGASRILGVSAAGSLREDIHPGDLAIPSQYFDHRRGKREDSFFGGGIAAHVSTAMPVCSALTSDIIAAAKRLGERVQQDKTYACVEGPRLGTRAESFFLRDAARCDLVGMTNIPEAFLAREAQLAYCTLCIVTDYDCWMDDPAQHVSVEKFFETYAAGVEKAKNILKELLQGPFSETPEDIRTALKYAVLTSEENMNEEQKQLLAVLRA